MTAVWTYTGLILFPILILLGILMRANQGGVITVPADRFFSFLTLHGLGMAGTWFVIGMASNDYLLNKYTRSPLVGNIVAYILTVIGVVLLIIATFIGKFAAGWYFLYPLPFYRTWEEWATPLFLVSIAVLGVGWLVWTVSMLIGILRKYPLSQALAWHYLRGKKEPEVPPFIVVLTATLIGIFICLLAGVTLLTLYFGEHLGWMKNDALLMKNLTFIFGHTLVNEMLYLAVAVLYELYPEFGRRAKWKTAWYVALSWNATFLIVMFAYFHHLYMDFVQPTGFQFIGQIASFLAPLPAAVVTIFSVLAYTYRNSMKWNLASLLYFYGVLGWAIGGVAAVLDATIVNNFVLHNTQWVPAHFHTYNLLGQIFFNLAFVVWFAEKVSGTPFSVGLSRSVFALLLFGGWGFVSMFYLSGTFSIPRRFNLYPPDLPLGTTLAKAAVIFALLYLLGIIVFFFGASQRCAKAFSR
ncbi:Putative cytochrome c oxidase, subunit I [Candidatus Methylomirabilis oxygeniifera]|uniref:Putative cytochrome c oxidase, subunit I n=1 Tax=Methylomirabilis oxygeniifera TaxID=671143 RepID=D5MLJ8_METO1|nr:Putative cytochrome c oxidase, subunit I [Candidatus Methylomirabilis oxyfera]